MKTPHGFDTLNSLEFSKHIGVSAAAVVGYIKTGRIKSTSMWTPPGAKKPRIITHLAVLDMQAFTEASGAKPQRTQGGLTRNGPEGEKVNKPTKKQFQEWLETSGTDLGNDYEFSEDDYDADGNLKKPPVVVNENPTTFGDAMLLDAVAKAKLSLLKYQQLNGDLWPKQPIQDQLAALGVQMRSDAASIGQRLGALIAAETNPQLCINMIDAEINGLFEKHSLKLK